MTGINPKRLLNYIEDKEERQRWIEIREQDNSLDIPQDLPPLITQETIYTPFSRVTYLPPPDDDFVLELAKLMPVLKKRTFKREVSASMDIIMKEL